MNPIMQAHSGAAEQKDKQLSTITKKIMQNEERLSQVKASQETAAPLDRSTPWTRNYERWDMWEDADEYYTYFGNYKSQTAFFSSIPDQTAEVTRPASVTVRYTDIEGDIKTLTAEGLLAACVQHEIDHLNGVLFIDRISRLKRDMIVRRVMKDMRQSSSKS